MDTFMLDPYVDISIIRVRKISKRRLEGEDLLG